MLTPDFPLTVNAPKSEDITITVVQDQPDNSYIDISDGTLEYFNNDMVNTVPIIIEAQINKTYSNNLYVFVYYENEESPNSSSLLIEKNNQTLYSESGLEEGEFDDDLAVVDGDLIRITLTPATIANGNSNSVEIGLGDSEVRTDKDNSISAYGRAVFKETGKYLGLNMEMEKGLHFFPDKDAVFISTQDQDANTATSYGSAIFSIFRGNNTNVLLNNSFGSFQSVTGNNRSMSNGFYSLVNSSLIGNSTYFTDSYISGRNNTYNNRVNHSNIISNTVDLQKEIDYSSYIGLSDILGKLENSLLVGRQNTSVYNLVRSIGTVYLSDLQNSTFNNSIITTDNTSATDLSTFNSFISSKNSDLSGIYRSSLYLGRSLDISEGMSSSIATGNNSDVESINESICIFNQTNTSRAISRSLLSGYKFNAGVESDVVNSVLALSDAGLSGDIRQSLGVSSATNMSSSDKSLFLSIFTKNSIGEVSFDESLGLVISPHSSGVYESLDIANSISLVYKTQGEGDGTSRIKIEESLFSSVADRFNNDVSNRILSSSFLSRNNIYNSSLFARNVGYALGVTFGAVNDNTYSISDNMFKLTSSNIVRAQRSVLAGDNINGEFYDCNVFGRAINSTGLITGAFATGLGIEMYPSDDFQLLIGEFNEEHSLNVDGQRRVFVIGNGVDDSNRSNAMYLEDDGELYLPAYADGQISIQNGKVVSTTEKQASGFKATAIAGQTTINVGSDLSLIPNNEWSVIVIVDGLEKTAGATDDYVINASGELVFNAALLGGEKIKVRWYE